jgi:ABC-type transport system substrate-binding protein
MVLGSLSVLAAILFAGCGGKTPVRGTKCTWVAGRAQPAFDPTGPRDPLRWSLERLLTRGLVEEDSSGNPVPAAAEGWEWSADSLTVTFRLREGLMFTDGSPCRSEDFRRALVAGLARTDHASKAWLLGSVAGVSRVRAGRALPSVGIDTPDPRTLVIRLTRRDPALLKKLGLPGVSAPWGQGTGDGWAGAAGLGPYDVLVEEPGRALTLLRRTGDGPDTVTVRFQPATARVLAFLRRGGADLVWPLPSPLEVRAVPSSYRLVTREADPPRWLMLVMRADLPPTTRLTTRRALAHAVDRDRVRDVLGPRGGPVGPLVPGGGGFEFPRLDEGQVRDWMERGGLGRAFHVVMAHDADGAGGGVARVLQGDWARLGIYAELRPRRGARLDREMLKGLSHLALAEVQPWTNDPAGVLALFVMPLRGPAVGACRTGWRTREFDGWLAPGRGPEPPGPEQAQARLAETLVALPLAGLPWAWLAREGGSALPFHPRFGPGCAGQAWSAAGPARR